MGGNAMQAFGAVRVQASVAHQKAAEVSQALDRVLLRHGADRPCHVIRAYREKLTFGDLDLLVQEEAVNAIGKEFLVQELGRALGYELPYYQVHPKAPQFHTALPLGGGGEALQVDFILTPEISFDYAKDYYAWNDLSKLIQILARTMSGMNFGVDGLSRRITLKEQVIGHVTFTRDFQAALKFLGYDADRFAQGFDNLDAMYRFAIANPRFNSSMYQWENRNARGRGQDMDRPTYLGFLEWMKDRDLPEHAPQDETDWVAKAYDTFPEAHAERDALYAQVEAQASIRRRFNGEVVTKLTGLKREQLGAFMKAFRKIEGEESFVETVKSLTDRELHERIESFHMLYCKMPQQSISDVSPD